MLECRGCHSVTLKRTFSHSEDDGAEVQYFPPPVSRRKPSSADMLMNVPIDLDTLWTEVYSALHGGLRRLALMGTRTMLDMITLKQVGDCGGFEQKLKALQNNGLITQGNSDILNAALEAGNAASHRGHVPKIEDLEAVLDIVEHLIQSVYVFPKVKVRLETNTPPRVKQK